MPLVSLIRKLVTFALMPLGVTVWLLLFAVVFRKRALTALALAWIYLISIPLTGDTLIGSLEDRFPRMSAQQCPVGDAAIVLGGLVADIPAGPGTVEWSDAVDRLEQGILVVKAGKAPRLFVSGGDFPWVKPPYSEADAMRDAAVARGIAPEAITVMPRSDNTAAEASAVAELARRMKLGRIILITSAFHMPRASFLFQRQGLDVIPFPTDYRKKKGRPAELLDFVPSAGGLENSEIAMKEFYGLLFYRLFPPRTPASR